jgi:predicted lipoprotein with Yx(FWY)xxD motif
MTTVRWLRMAAVVAGSAALLGACGGTTSGPAATASPSPSATPTPTPTPSAAPILLAQSVGTMGTILVAGANGHTVYTFDSDAPGASKCNGGCASIWPPLSIASGVTPTGGPGVTGQLGTITRSDGSMQVTYKALPLYFFHSDSQAGDIKGNYTGWSLVKP